MRVLLVEDEMDMARALTAALSRHDIIVDHAPTLEIAEEAAMSGLHDAVLLDHHCEVVNRVEWRCAFQPLLPERSPRSDFPAYKKKARKIIDAVQHTLLDHLLMQLFSLWWIHRIIKSTI